MPDSVVDRVAAYLQPSAELLAEQEAIRDDRENDAGLAISETREAQEATYNLEENVADHSPPEAPEAEDYPEHVAALEKLSELLDEHEAIRVDLADVTPEPQTDRVVARDRKEFFEVCTQIAEEQLNAVATKAYTRLREVEFSRLYHSLRAMRDVVLANRQRRIGRRGHKRPLVGHGAAAVVATAAGIAYRRHRGSP